MFISSNSRSLAQSRWLKNSWNSEKKCSTVEIVKKNKWNKEWMVEIDKSCNVQILPLQEVVFKSDRNT